MPDWLLNPTFWDWWVLAALAAFIDVFRSAAGWRGMALGTGTTGFVALLVPGLWGPVQWGLAVAISLVAGLGLWAFARWRG